MNTPTTDNATEEIAAEPDNVDKLGELLTVFSAGKRISTGHIERDDAMIFGAGLYAIADQLRRIAAALEANRG